MSVRPSVCLSVTFVYCIETSKQILKLFPLSIPRRSSFFRTKRRDNIPTKTLIKGYRMQMKNEKISRLPTNIWLYLRNDTRYGHSYCRTPKEIRMRSVEWRHDLEWVTDISSARHYSTLNISETVQDRDSYNEILVRTYTRFTQRCNFEWPWPTLSDLAKCPLTWSVARPFVIDELLVFKILNGHFRMRSFKLQLTLIRSLAFTRLRVYSHLSIYKRSTAQRNVCVNGS